MPKRLDYIDKAKGTLIILVVIGHILQSGPVFNVIYSFHMPAFFVISGILMSVTRSYEKRFGGFLVSRLFSLGIPLIIGSIAAIFAAGLFLDRDSGRMFSPNALAFLISGLCGTYAVIQAGKISFPHIIERTLTQAGMNTIIIFGIHHFYYAVIGKLMGVTDYSTTPIVTGLIILLGVAILEVPTICIINRWVPWMAGKRRKVRMQ